MNATRKRANNRHRWDAGQFNEFEFKFILAVNVGFVLSIRAAKLVSILCVRKEDQTF